VVGRDRCRQCAQGAEECEAEPRPADHRADEEQGGRLRRGGEHDGRRPSGERHRPAGGADPRRAAAERELRRRTTGCENEHAYAGHDVVRRVEQACRQLRTEGQKQAADRPRRKHRQRGEQERPAHGGGNTRALRGQAETRPGRDRLGHEQRADEGYGEEDEQHDVRQHARGREQLDQRRRDEDTKADAAGAGHAVGQPDAGGIAPRVQVEERGARRTQRQAGREALQAACDEQPRD